MTEHKPTLFDPSKARGPKRGPDVGEEAPADAAAPMSVSLLIARVKGALAEALPQRLFVVGELSNVKRHTSGHLYFRLKDENCAIDAAMFRHRASRLKFTPTDGLEVIVEGRVDVYDVRGQLQLYVEDMTPKGAGALELAFRQLKEKLEREGLFDPAAKKPIPRFPRALGVVSSATGAAIRDIRRTLFRRWPGATVYLVPVLVQGEGAAGQIAEAVRLLDAHAERLQIDTILVARGGGSLEDLWAFNEEAVARAIFAARTPVISGVGHEVDVTIADLVADVRAPTPTGAAELAVPDRAEVRRHVAHLYSRLRALIRDDVKSSRAALESVLRSAVFRDPTGRLRTQAQRLDELGHRLRSGAVECAAAARRRLHPLERSLAALHPARLAERAGARLEAIGHRLAWVLGARSKRAGDGLAAAERSLAAAHPRHRLGLARQKVDALRRQLESLGHKRVLHRGFSLTYGADGKLLRSVAGVGPGQRIQTELLDGRLTSRVESGGAEAGVPKAPVKKTPKGKPDESQGTLFDA